MKRWKLATEKVIKAKSSGRNKLQQTVKFVAAIDDMERFVSIMTGAITNLPSPGVTSDEIEMQLSDLEVINPVENLQIPVALGLKEPRFWEYSAICFFILNPSYSAFNF